MADLHRLPHRLGDPAPGRIDQRAGRRMRDENPRQVEQQRRVLVAARIQPGQRHREFAPAHVGVADQVEGGIGRDEAVLGIGAQQMRAAGADHRFDLGRFGRAPRGRRRRGLGMVRPRYLSISAATGAPIAAQSGAASSRAWVSAARKRCQARRLVAQRGQPGPAQAAAAAPDCRARSGRIFRDAGRRRGIPAAGDRRRHKARGRPCGRSTPGTRRRRNSENPWKLFPPEPSSVQVIPTAAAGRSQAASL